MYHEMLNHNRLTRWLHSLRYKTVLKLIDQACKLVKTRPLRIVEIGCADAKLYSLIRGNYDVLYRGIEVDRSFFNTAAHRYFSDPNFSIVLGNPTTIDFYNAFDGFSPDLVICLETFEHMPSDNVWNILASMPRTTLLCSIPVEHGLPVLVKNTLSMLMGYHRHKNYSLRETLAAAFGRLAPHNNCHKGFNFKSVDEKIRNKFSNVKRYSIPFRWLPWWLSNSVFYIAYR